MTIFDKIIHISFNIGPRILNLHTLGHPFISAGHLLGECLLLCFPSFQSGGEGDRESGGGQSRRDPGGATLTNETLVGPVGGTAPSAAHIQREEEQPQANRSTRQPGVAKQKPVGGLPFVSKSLRSKGFDKSTIGLIMDAWRPSTKKLYSTYLNKWAVFCMERDINPLSPALPQACRFLRLLSERGLGYAALNSAKCALATILPQYEGHTFGTHPLVCWLVKGGYERNPPPPNLDMRSLGT